MIPYSESQRRKAEAKKYIDTVIDQMSKADNDLKKIIKSHASDLIGFCMSYKYLSKSFQFSANSDLERKVNDTLDKLKKDIFNIIYTRAEYVNDLAFEKENKEKNHFFLTAFITSKIADKTLEQRIGQCVKMLGSEIEAYIAAGISKGLSGHGIITQYYTWLNKPYKAPLLLEAFREKGFKADVLMSKGLTFGAGTGKYVSGFNNLVRLQQQTIFHAYNNTLNHIWLLDKTVVGWYTVRGSSYPCSVCDDNIGVFHPKEDFFFGYHIRCCCIMLPVYIYDVV